MKETHKLTPEQKIEIIDKYKTGNYTCKQLGDLYNVTKNSIWKYLKNQNITINNDQSKLQRKYKLNQNYFDKIDTEDKAYFLGLLYADGCNYPPNNVIVINLQERDKDILEKFRHFLEYEKPLYYVVYNQENWSNQYRLHLNSKHMSDRLIELGCTSQKSLTLTFPNSNQVPDYLLKHFIRGYFDGDGCTHISKKYKATTCSFVSTESFCKSLQDVLENIGIHCTLNKSDKNDITKSISISGNFQNKRFLDWLYEDASIYLERKYQKYQELCLIIKSKTQTSTIE